MAKKENQRVRITKKMLKSALTELLKEKSIYKISIRELCEKAEINRSTFYKYYGSQFDLLADIENDMIHSVVDPLSNDMAQAGNPLSEVLHYIENNIELVGLFINNNIDSQFLKKIISMPQIQEKIDQILGDKYTESELEYISGFMTYGAYQVIRIWVNKDNRETPDEIADFLFNKVFHIASDD